MTEMAYDAFMALDAPGGFDENDTAEFDLVILVGEDQKYEHGFRIDPPRKVNVPHPDKPDAMITVELLATSTDAQRCCIRVRGTEIWVPTADLKAHNRQLAIGIAKS